MNTQIDYNALAESFIIPSEVRRNWLHLDLNSQAKIIHELDIPVHLPPRVGRFDPKMTEAYDKVFEHVKDAMDVFDEMVRAQLQTIEKNRFNRMLSGIDQRKNPRV
jgi:hypothetical protein